MMFGQPGDYLTYQNRYSALGGGQQQQQQGGMGDMLSNAKNAYDIYNYSTGKPGIFQQLLGMGGGGGSALTGDAALSAGGFLPGAGGATGTNIAGAAGPLTMDAVYPAAGGVAGADVGAAGGSSWLGGLGGGGSAAGAGIFGPLGIVGVGLLTAYLLDKKHDKLDAEKQQKRDALRAQLGEEGYAQWEAAEKAAAARQVQEDEENARRREAARVKPFNQPQWGD